MAALEPAAAGAGGGRADAVVTPTSGLVADLLARPKQLVYRGQGLAWLQGDAVGEVP